MMFMLLVGNELLLCASERAPVKIRPKFSEIVVSEEDIPIGRYPMKPERKRYPHPVAKFISREEK